MKRTIAVLLSAAVWLAVLAGCGMTGSHKPTAADNKAGSSFTVCIENQSAADLSSVAVSCSADGAVLGSRACERAEGKGETAVYTFAFSEDELPVDPVRVFRVEVYAAERPGEDYFACGSAEIENPAPGAVYTLVLRDDAASGLSVSKLGVQDKLRSFSKSIYLDMVGKTAAAALSRLPGADGDRHCPVTTGAGREES